MFEYTVGKRDVMFNLAYFHIALSRDLHKKIDELVLNAKKRNLFSQCIFYMPR